MNQCQSLVTLARLQAWGGIGGCFHFLFLDYDIIYNSGPQAFWLQGLASRAKLSSMDQWGEGNGFMRAT